MIEFLRTVLDATASSTLGVVITAVVTSTFVVTIFKLIIAMFSYSAAKKNEQAMRTAHTMQRQLTEDTLQAKLQLKEAEGKIKEYQDREEQRLQQLRDDSPHPPQSSEEFSFVGLLVKLGVIAGIVFFSVRVYQVWSDPHITSYRSFEKHLVHTTLDHAYSDAKLVILTDGRGEYFPHNSETSQSFSWFWSTNNQLCFTPSQNQQPRQGDCVDVYKEVQQITFSYFPINTDHTQWILRK